ncbi:DEAD/DEAH box helicase [Croceicoccus mobilis]|uniref:DEAD/DEAH box helicase n=1 Tax=Croceicoccus mobilis TaxID=1703339 RepID=A0A916Z3H9_9SPHN|nr:DEAD/DEAH box helicase [Croceicoccus mobilis]GGD74495.1 DEAD/DEAH box helicase [Croceicoccus mobilis]
MNFPDLPSVFAQTLDERGYTSLTAVQSAVLAPEASGRDLIVSAQTGSGKTVAFSLAFAENLLGDAEQLPFAEAPLALIIAPTRELAMQVSRELMWLYAKTGARIATCVGGMDPSKERRNLSRGAHIVVGTPGRLRDHLERGALDLTSLRVAVLDEADEMLDMGFREDLEELLDATPDGRRTLLFSATMPKPIVALAKRYQNDALRISTVGDDRGHGDIAYQAVTVAPAEIEAAVVNLLRFHEAETAILFCATRDNVRRLHATLQERGFAVVALSGEHSQSERNHALQALRDRRARVCVATDVAARGIDLPSLSLVVHVEIPRDAETLQHRSGRTGRAGKKGTAVIIVPYPRRRRVESMLRGARIEAEWIEAPSREAIRAQDRERLLEVLREPVEIEEDDRELGQRLLEERPAEEIAAMLVRAHRARMPQPEELTENTPEARRAAQADRHRPGFEDVRWFRIEVGRRQNADPRWILPLLCRRGHITRAEIGAIRIGPNETHFQVPTAIADKFAATLHRTAGDEGDRDALLIEPSDGPREAARENRGGRRGHDDGPRKAPFKHRGQGDDRPARGPKKFGAKKFDDAPHGDGPPRDAPKRPRNGPKKPFKGKGAGKPASGKPAFKGKPKKRG